VRYDISCDPATGRWHLDASWKAPARPAPSLHDLIAAPVVAADVNAGHLAVAVLAPDGNVTGTPFTIALEMAGLPATARDGRVRAAVSALIATAREHGARAVVIEDLNFAEARSQGREKTGNRAAPEDAARPAQARPRKPPATPAAPRKPAAPRGTRQPPRGKTGTPHRTTAGTQAPEDRSRAPTETALSTAQCLGTVVLLDCPAERRAAAARLAYAASDVCPHLHAAAQRRSRRL
jgi:hypothetical protein